MDSLCDSSSRFVRLTISHYSGLIMLLILATFYCYTVQRVIFVAIKFRMFLSIQFSNQYFRKWTIFRVDSEMSQLLSLQLLRNLEFYFRNETKNSKFSKLNSIKNYPLYGMSMHFFYEINVCACARAHTHNIRTLIHTQVHKHISTCMLASQLQYQHAGISKLQLAIRIKLL